MGYEWAAAARSDEAGRFGTEAFYASLGRAFVTMCAIIPALFLIEAIDVGLGSGTLDLAGGIIPRSMAGIDGILFSPFLHDGWQHLYGNAIPLILLGTFVMAGGARRFIWSTVLIAAVSGVGVWLIGDPDTVVVGASGVIFGYLGLLLVRGVVERSWWHFAVAAFVGLLYWYQFFNVLPTDQRISWQGHLLGLLGGMVAAVVFRRR
ncbi:rhomboid family intramembrane serine protease [Actinoplanes sp. CA-252034]|uniref:rhomboid family intramembrane serine protease n=1 Tax=Actinoplanes sp. CA-252034 TaxID=3239906 RepID=UPI003D97B88E